MSNKHSIEGLGEVPRAWTIAPLGDLVEYVTYGFTNPMPDSDVGPFKVTAKDVNHGRILYETARRTTWDAYDKLLTSKSKPAKGDVLLTKDGSIGRVAVVDRDGVCINQSVAVMRPRATTDARFLSYLLQTPYYQARMAADSDGSTIKHIYITRVDKMSVATPAIGEQKNVAAVLGALDDKIDHNRKTNRALEGFARAMFKAWFVDFEPVKAKAAGATSFPGMPAAAFAALPTRFVDSELGPVPEGSQVGKLGHFCDINKHKVGAEDINGEIEYIDIASVTVGRLEDVQRVLFAEAPSRARRRVRHGDTIWSCVRPNRRSYLFIHSPPENRIASTGFAVLSPADFGPSYLYELTTRQEFVDYLVSNADGSAYPAVRPEHFAEADVLVPSLIVRHAFERVTMPFRDLFAAGEAESLKLAQLRDYLLPSLLSGKVRVKDIQTRASDVQVEAM